MDNKGLLGLGTLVGAALILIAINVATPFGVPLVGVVLVCGCLGRLLWMHRLWVIYTLMSFALACVGYFVWLALQHLGVMGPYHSAWAVSKGWGDGNIGGAMSLAIVCALMLIGLAYGKGKVSH